MLFSLIDYGLNSQKYLLDVFLLYPVEFIYNKINQFAANTNNHRLAMLYIFHKYFSSHADL